MRTSEHNGNQRGYRENDPSDYDYRGPGNYGQRRSNRRRFGNRDYDYHEDMPPYQFENEGRFSSQGESEEDYENENYDYTDWQDRGHRMNSPHSQWLPRGNQGNWRSQGRFSQREYAPGRSRSRDFSPSYNTEERYRSFGRTAGSGGYGESGTDYRSGEGRSTGSYSGYYQPSSSRSRDYQSYGENEQQQRGQYSGRGPKGYQRSKDRIEEEINDMLTADPELNAEEIKVTVDDNREVTLRGHCDSRAAKRRAEDICERVAGVTDVNNQLKVKSSREQDESQTKKPGTSSARQ